MDGSECSRSRSSPGSRSRSGRRSRSTPTSSSSTRASTSYGGRVPVRVLHSRGGQRRGDPGRPTPGQPRAGRIFRGDGSGEPRQAQRQRDRQFPVKVVVMTGQAFRQMKREVPGVCERITGRSKSAVVDRARVAVRPPPQRAIDRLGREHVLDGHRGRPDHARPVAELARDDPEVARRQGQRPAEDPLAHSRQELSTRLGDVAAAADRARRGGHQGQRQGVRETSPRRPPPTGCPAHPAGRLAFGVGRTRQGVHRPRGRGERRKEVGDGSSVPAGGVVLVSLLSCLIVALPAVAASPNARRPRATAPPWPRRRNAWTRAPRSGSRP